MPRLVVENLSTSDTVIYDPSGYSSFKKELAAGAVANLDVSSSLLERMEPIITELQVAGTIAYRVQADPAVPDVFEALGVSSMVLKELVQVIDTTTLNAAAVTQAVAITGFPSKSFPVAAAIQLDTAFSGGAVATCTAEIGDAGATGELCAALDVFTGATTGMRSTAGAASGAFVLEAAYAPICTITTTVANVSELTAGSLVVHIWYMTPATYTVLA